MTLCCWGSVFWCLREQSAFIFKSWGVQEFFFSFLKCHAVEEYFFLDSLILEYESITFLQEVKGG